MSVKFEVKMTDKIMYDFLLYHTYTHMSGLLGAMIGSACPWDGNQLYAVGRFYGGDAGIYISGTVLGGDAGFPERKGKDTGTKNEDVSKAIRI